MIFLRKILIFHTKYPKKFSRLRPLGAIFLSAPLNLNILEPPLHSLLDIHFVFIIETYSVTLNSVLREIMSSLTIVSYEIKSEDGIKHSDDFFWYVRFFITNITVTQPDTISQDTINYYVLQQFLTNVHVLSN